MLPAAGFTPLRAFVPPCLRAFLLRNIHQQARLLTLKTAWMIDNVGVRNARIEIAAIKVVAPETLRWISDRAIQVFGGAGFTEDFPVAEFYSMARWLQIADGPDEVHKRSVARAELARYEPGQVPEPYVFE